MVEPIFGAGITSRNIMATLTKKSTKRASKKARKPSGATPRSAAEQKLVDGGKASDGKQSTMVRWMPTHAGDSFKQQTFDAWLKAPNDATLAATLHKRFMEKISISSLRKWLNNFGSGCKRPGSRYPRGAAGREKEIAAALKKSTGAKISAEALKALKRTS